jgi:hypothetical protein
MRSFNEYKITASVLERVAGASDSRIRQISEALARHLDAFVREVRHTQKEWKYSNDFLTVGLFTGHSLVQEVHLRLSVSQSPFCEGKSVREPRREQRVSGLVS